MFVASNRLFLKFKKEGLLKKNRGSSIYCKVWLCVLLLTMVTKVVYSQNSLTFDKDLDHVVTVPYDPVYSVTGDFTLEAIINAKASQTNYPQILSNRSGVSTGFLFGLYLDGRPYMRVQAQNYFYNKGTGTDLRDNTCHHVVFTKKDSVISLYVDGVYEDQLVIKSSLTSLAPLLIGNDYQGSGVAFNGGIKEVRFWNVNRTQSELNTYRQSYLLGNEDGLIGYWKLNDDGQVVKDYSSNKNNGLLGISEVDNQRDPTTTNDPCPFSYVLDSKSIGYCANEEQNISIESCSPCIWVNGVTDSIIAENVVEYPISDELSSIVVRKPNNETTYAIYEKTEEVCNPTPEPEDIKSELKVFQVITPNGDGKNDFLEIEHIDEYSNIGIRVHDGRNQEVFYADSYDNSWGFENYEDGIYYVSVFSTEIDSPFVVEVVVKR